MPITPDTKDWTWVLRRPCPECGFDAALVSPGTVADLVRGNAEQWARALEAPADLLATRPADDRWAPVEYACHVRDVFRLYRYRLGLMLSEDGPDFPNWDQDENAVADRYLEQDPATVSAELVEDAHALADALAPVSGDQWQRTGRRSDGAEFTVETFVLYMVHDPIHHLWDVTTDLERTGGVTG